MDKQTFLTRFLLHKPPSEGDLRSVEKAHFITNKSLQKAAVLMPIVKRANGLNIILTERALHLRHHPGQISFPGGKHEQTDKSLQHTALREMQEEIGILQTQVCVVGKLASLATVSGFMITPYMGFVQHNHTLLIDQKEVKSVFEVPLEYLLNKDNFHKEYLFANSQRHYTYCIPYQNRLIWGATAQLIFNLQKQLNG